MLKIDTIREIESQIENLKVKHEDISNHLISSKEINYEEVSRMQALEVKISRRLNWVDYLVNERELPLEYQYEFAL